MIIASGSSFAQDATSSPSPSASPKKTHRHRAAAQVSPTPATPSVTGSPSTSDSRDPGNRWRQRSSLGEYCDPRVSQGRLPLLREDKTWKVFERAGSI